MCVCVCVCGSNTRYSVVATASRSRYSHPTVHVSPGMPASTSNGEEHCAREIAMRVAMASEKRRIEEVTPGGGDESMDPDDVGWPRSPKRMREDS